MANFLFRNEYYFVQFPVSFLVVEKHESFPTIEEKINILILLRSYIYTIEDNDVGCQIIEGGVVV